MQLWRILAQVSPFIGFIGFAFAAFAAFAFTIACFFSTNDLFPLGRSLQWHMMRPILHV